MPIKDTQNYILNTRKIYSGNAWISHGNNIVTFISGSQAFQNSSSFAVVATIGLTELTDVTTRMFVHTRVQPVFVSTNTVSMSYSPGSIFKVRLDTAYGFSALGYSGSANISSNERFDEVSNTQAIRTTLSTRRGAGGCSLIGYGFTLGGNTTVAVGTNQRFDDIINAAKSRLTLTATSNVSVYTLDGYIYYMAGVGNGQRFDDITNSAAATNTPAIYSCASFSVNRYGFYAGGGVSPSIVSNLQRYSSDTNSYSIRNTSTVARTFIRGYALNGFGFSTCGSGSSAILGTTQR